MLSEERIDQLLQYVEDIRCHIAEQSAEITRLKAEIAELKLEGGDLLFWGKHPACRVHMLFRVCVDTIDIFEDGEWVLFRETVDTVDDFRLLIDSGAMKRVSKAEPNPLTSTGGSE